MLHVNDNGFVNRTCIAQVLSLLQNSSPGSILLTSSDAIRMQMVIQGHQRLSTVIILAQNARLSEFIASSLLRNQHNIEVKFDDLKHIICSITVADTELTVSKFLVALLNLTEEKYQIINSNEMSIKPPNELPQSAINLCDAVGHILAENVIPYSPGTLYWFTVK